MLRRGAKNNACFLELSQSILKKHLCYVRAYTRYCTRECQDERRKIHLGAEKGALILRHGDLTPPRSYLTPLRPPRRMTPDSQQKKALFGKNLEVDVRAIRTAQSAVHGYLDYNATSLAHGW